MDKGKLAIMVLYSAAVFALFLVLASISECNTAAAQVNPGDDPISGVCLDVPPVCKAGQDPICLCPDDITLECRWICGKVRR